MDNNEHNNAMVYIVSDSAGETAELAVRAAASQFYPLTVEIRRVSFIGDEGSIDRVVNNASEHRAIIVFTLVVPRLRKYLLKKAAASGVKTTDLLGPIIDRLEHVFGTESRHIPGMIHRMDEDYFKKVDAVEFAVKYDDGRDYKGVLLADIILVGVSRTSKTPLSMYLAHKQFKVANVPLVPEIQPPDELFTVDKNKIVGLIIEPSQLNIIRKERLKALGLRDNALYADLERIEKELHYAKSIMKRLGCVVIDVTNKAVEETATMIVDMFSSPR